jgi:hypothetical protein
VSEIKAIFVTVTVEVKLVVFCCLIACSLPMLSFSITQSVKQPAQHWKRKKSCGKKKKNIESKKKKIVTHFFALVVYRQKKKTKKQKLESEKGLKSFPSFFIVSAFLIVSGYFSQTILL